MARFLKGCDFAGYNILHFDLPMLEAEFRRVGVPLGMKGREVIDVMAIYFQKEPRDLKAALRFLLWSRACQCALSFRRRMRLPERIAGPN